MLPYFARHINNWFKKDTLEYHYQKHLILLFAIHCMRMFCRHDDGFAFVEFVFYAVDGDFTGSVEAGDEASPPDSWVLISSPLSKANKVMLTDSFCTSVLLTIWPFLVGNLDSF